MGLRVALAGIPLSIGALVGGSANHKNAAADLVTMPTGPRTVVDVVARVVTASALVMGMELGEESGTRVPRGKGDLPRIDGMIT